MVAGNDIVYSYNAFSGEPPLNTGSLKRDVWQYEPSSDRWQRKSDFPGETRYSMVGFSLGNKGYMGLGYYIDGNYQHRYFKEFWKYDPESDVWIKKAEFSGNIRRGMTAFSIGKKAMLN